MQAGHSSSLIYASGDKTNPPKPVNIICTELAGLSLESIAEPGFFELFKSSENRVVFEKKLDKRLNHQILPVEQVVQLMQDAASLHSYREQLTDVDSVKKIDELIYMCHLIVVAHNQALIYKLSSGRSVAGMNRSEFLTELSLKIISVLHQYKGKSKPHTYIGSIAKNMSITMSTKSKNALKKMPRLEADISVEPDVRLKDPDLIGHQKPTIHLRRYPEKKTETAMHQDTAAKLRSFIMGISTLSKKQKKIYMQNKGLLEKSPPGGETMVKIAKRYGVSRQSIDQQIKRVTTTLREALNEQGLTMEDFLP